MTATRPRMLPTWILRVLAILGLVCCLPPIFVGAALIISDAQDPDAEMYGLGILLGGILAGVALAVAFVVGVLLLMLCLWPRVGLVGTAVVAGTLCLGFGVLAVSQLGSDGSVAEAVVGFAVFGGSALGVLGLAVWGLWPRDAEVPAYGSIGG